MSLVLAVFGAAFAGCASAPVQEMSDARQAIMAAEDAGAEQYAPEPLGRARDHLSLARQSLRGGSYDRARVAARQAREDAIVALEQAQAARTTGTE